MVAQAVFLHRSSFFLFLGFWIIDFRKNFPASLWTSLVFLFDGTYKTCIQSHRLLQSHKGLLLICPANGGKKIVALWHLSTFSALLEVINGFVSSLSNGTICSILKWQNNLALHVQFVKALAHAGGNLLHAKLEHQFILLSGSPCIIQVPCDGCAISHREKT